MAGKIMSMISVNKNLKYFVKLCVCNAKFFHNGRCDRLLVADKKMMLVFGLDVKE